MKQLRNLLNTTLQSQPQSARADRPGSASSKALSSVAAAADDNSDVAVVPPPALRPNLGVTFVKASPSVITVPSQLPTAPDDVDAVYGVEPRSQLGMLLIELVFVNSV